MMMRISFFLHLANFPMCPSPCTYRDCPAAQHTHTLAESSINPLLSRFDITAAVSAGRSGNQTEHTLCVRVYRFCDGSYLEDQVLLPT